VLSGCACQRAGGAWGSNAGQPEQLQLGNGPAGVLVRAFPHGSGRALRQPSLTRRASPWPVQLDFSSSETRLSCKRGNHGTACSSSWVAPVTAERSTRPK